MSVFKVETDIITSVTVSLVEQAVILVIMYAQTFKLTLFYCFIGIKRRTMMAYASMFFSIRVTKLKLIISK